MHSPVDWLTDSEYSQLPACERALAQAAARVGVREVGVNAGPWVERFLRSVGLGRGYAWCAAFVSFCLIEAGVPIAKLPKRRSAVRDWVKWAEQNGRYRTLPKRGRLFFWLDGARGHIGWVAGVVGEITTTIEGNTNDGGSREGDGVYRRRRHAANLRTHAKSGYIDLGALD